MGSHCSTGIKFQLYELNIRSRDLLYNTVPVVELAILCCMLKNLLREISCYALLSPKNLIKILLKKAKLFPASLFGLKCYTYFMIPLR